MAVFLTTACAVHFGDAFSDEGIELETLRVHRDRLAQERPALRSKVDEYYRLAPIIVSRIDEADNSAAVYREIFDQMVEPTNVALRSGDDDEAVRIYSEGFNRLKSIYLK